MKLITILFVAGAALAQMPAAHIADSKARYVAFRDNIQKAAEAMPEESYNFKPTPDIRSFGELMGHIADAQAGICGSATGQRKALGAAKMTSKADLVGALKTSSEICTAAFDATTDANANDAASMGQMKSTRLGILEYNTGHDAEEYGYAAVYLRLKNVLPPSSAPRK